MTVEHYSPIVKEIIETYIDKIEKDNFSLAIDRAIQENVLEQLLDVLYETDIVVPPETVFARLCKACISATPLLSSREKEHKTAIAKHLINKQQVNVFKSLGK